MSVPDAVPVRHQGFVAWLRRLTRDRGGMAAVEFAMIMPVLLFLYIGALDVTRGVMASRKVNLLSRTISDLVSQQSTTAATPSSKISLIFTTASAVMAPYDTSTLTLTVSAIDLMAKSDKSCCQAKVRWTYTNGGSDTLRSCTTPPVLADPGTKLDLTNMPKAIGDANKDAGYNYAGGLSSYVIAADVSYSYTPFFQQTIGWFSGGLTKSTFMVPRATSGAVTLASPVNAASGQTGKICF